MKELIPHKKSDVIPFAISVQETLDKANVQLGTENVSIANIYEHGRFACIARGSSFEVVNIKTGQRRAAFDFNIQNTKQTITAFCTYGNKFIISIRCNATDTGQICIYDPGLSRIVKVVAIPNVPVSLVLIKEYGGASEVSTLYSMVIKCMFGVVAVGTDNGHIYLIDLGSDDIIEQFTASQPSSLLIIDPSETGNFAALREKARNDNMHCCLDLSYSLCSRNAFKYVDVAGEIAKVCSSENCSITSLKYLREAYVLIVGFSFGCFQLWSLENLRLLYSSPIGLYSSPVTHFAFQEPDDDPRCCCYLWVGRGPISNQIEISSPTSLALYQLLFELKERRHNGGYEYKHIQCVIRRFDHQLTSDVHHMVDSISVGSRIINMTTLEQYSPGNTTNDNTDSLNRNEKDTTICYVVWETPTTDMESSMSCHLGIFDINRWYQKQFPSSIRDAMYGRMEAVCPFFAFYSLTDIAEAFLPNGIMDTFVDCASLSEFRNVEGPQSEQFYWPSSSAFTIVCISESGCIQVEMLGIQRQIMADMRNLGTDSFLDAQDLVQSCWVAGLLQNSTDIIKPSGEKRNTDAVLSLSLEHNGTAFITDCIKKWSHGSITHAGHSLKLIYDWAWNQVVQYKKTFDHLHLPMFCSLSERLEKGHQNRLFRISIELQHLADIFKELQRAQAITVQDGINEINTRLRVASYLSLYADILLLLNHCGLLPEQPDCVSNEAVDRITYPYQMLLDYYEDERKKPVSNNNSIAGPCLFIDSLWQQMRLVHENEDKTDNATISSHIYPPPTIEIMCRLFLENLLEDNTQISIFYYWILDICECCEELLNMKIGKKFKECLKLDHEKAILLESVWLMDHKLYKDAAEHLSLVTSKLSSFYYHQIVNILYYRGELSFLTLFCSSKEPTDRCTYEETKFLITVLLEMKMLPNAHKLQTNFSMRSKKTDLFGYFVEKCKENKMLGKLISLSLTATEEEMLRCFLESSNENEDYLLVYYLERGLYNEAFRLSKKLKNSTTFNVDRISQEHSLTKCLLVDGFLQAVPSIQQLQTSAPDVSVNFSAESDGAPPLSTFIRKFGTNKDASTLARRSFDSTRRNENCNHDKIFSSSKSFFADTFTNQRRRKSPLFDGEVVSPTKKPKEMSPPCAANKVLSSISGKRRKNLFSGTDAYLLLKTPPARRSSKLIAVSKDNTKTPQSILKSRITSRFAGSKSAARAPRSPTFKASTAAKSFTPGRKIRFAGLASPTSPITPLSASVDGSTTAEEVISEPVSLEKQSLDLSMVSNESLEYESFDGSFVSKTSQQPEKSSIMEQPTCTRQLSVEKEASLLDDFLDNEVDASYLNTSTVDEILDILDAEVAGSRTLVETTTSLVHSSSRDDVSGQNERTKNSETKVNSDVFPETTRDSWKTPIETETDGIASKMNFPEAVVLLQDCTDDTDLAKITENESDDTEADGETSSSEDGDNLDSNVNTDDDDDVDMESNDARQSLKKSDVNKSSRDVNEPNTIQIIDSSSEDEDIYADLDVSCPMDVEKSEVWKYDGNVEDEDVLARESFSDENIRTRSSETGEIIDEDLLAILAEEANIDEIEIDEEEFQVELGEDERNEFHNEDHKEEFESEQMVVDKRKDEEETLVVDIINENKNASIFVQPGRTDIDASVSVVFDRMSTLKEKDNLDDGVRDTKPLSSSFVDEDSASVNCSHPDASAVYVEAQTTDSSVVISDAQVVSSTASTTEESAAARVISDLIKRDDAVVARKSPIMESAENDETYTFPSFQEKSCYLDETMEFVDDGQSSISLTSTGKKISRKKIPSTRRSVTRSAAKHMGSDEMLNSTIDQTNKQTKDSILDNTVDSILDQTNASSVYEKSIVKGSTRPRGQRKTTNSTARVTTRGADNKKLDSNQAVSFANDSSIVEVKMTTRSRSVNKGKSKNDVTLDSTLNSVANETGVSFVDESVVEVNKKKKSKGVKKGKSKKDVALDSTLNSVANETGVSFVDESVVEVNIKKKSKGVKKGKSKTDAAMDSTLNSVANETGVSFVDESVVEVNKKKKSKGVKKGKSKTDAAMDSTLNSFAEVDKKTGSRNVPASPARSTRDNKKSDSHIVDDAKSPARMNRTEKEEESRRTGNVSSPARNTRSKKNSDLPTLDFNVMISPLDGGLAELQYNTLSSNLTKVNKKDDSSDTTREVNVTRRKSSVLVGSATKQRLSPKRSPKKLKESKVRNTRLSHGDKVNKPNDISSSVRATSASVDVDDSMMDVVEPQILRTNLRNRTRSESHNAISPVKATESILSFVPIEDKHLLRQSKRSSSKRASLAVTEQLKNTPRRSMRARVATTKS